MIAKNAKINVGTVGLGNTGRQHLKFYLKNNSIEKIFVSEIKKIQKPINKKIIIDKNLGKFKKIKGKKLLSISNFDKDHSKFILKYFNGNHIFVEKPMCRNFKQLNEIYKLAKKNKFKNLLSSNLVLRASEIFNKIKKKIRNGEFGNIYYFEGDYLYGRLNKLTKGWRGLDKDYSVTLGGGIHLIDLMISFFDQLPEYVETYSNKIVTKKNKFKFNDFTQSNYFFKNGALAKITSNFGCVHKHQHVLKIYGTKKTFIYDDMGARIFNRRDPFSGKMYNVEKLYSGKDCLLPDFFKNLKLNKNYKKNIIREINLMSTSISSDISLMKNKKIKIKKYI